MKAGSYIDPETDTCTMTKIWVNETKGDDRIIAFIGDMVYKCNPKAEETDHYVQSLQMNMIPAKAVHGVPASYIAEVRLQEGKKTFKLILGGGTEEDFTVSDNTRRKEIFESAKQLLPAHEHTVDKLSWLEAGRKPLIAFAILTGLFIWTLVIAGSMETGAQWDVEGGRYGSFAGIVLVLASFGVKKVLLIFGLLGAIAAFSFVKKAKSPPVYDRIIRR